MQGYVPQAEYDALKAQNKALGEQLEEVKFQLADFKRLVFGAKSERYIADRNEEQLSLFEGAACPGQRGRKDQCTGSRSYERQDKEKTGPTEIARASQTGGIRYRTGGCGSDQYGTHW